MKQTIATPVHTEKIESVYQQQKRFFLDGGTRSVQWRKSMLKQLKQRIREYEPEIEKAIANDFSKPELEIYASETGYVLSEIDHALHDLQQWAQPERVSDSLLTFPSRSYLYKEPYGIALVIAPWNYPFQLALAPVVAALAAGNTVILKPSEISSHTSQVIAKMINAHFDASVLHVVEGAVDTTQFLLHQPNDYIFFTGSTRVGKIVMKAAAEQLTPLTLELGGKSPAIVDATAPVSLTAKRILFGKCFNAGQTCIAPDYVLVHASKKAALIEAFKASLNSFYGTNPKTSPDYARIINEDHFNRLVSYLSDGNILIGGAYDAETRYMDPTVIELEETDVPVMKEEIFGPILPVITYRNLDEVVAIVRKNPKPLSLYCFSKSKRFQKQILEQLQFGGGTINDTVEHYLNPQLPFGGIGPSGIGAYHGKYGFNAFSHTKAVLKKSYFPDLPLKYPPYKNKLKWLKLAFKIT